jgi:poly(beta-D-mannuronate) lyase
MTDGVWTDQQIEFAGNGTAFDSIVLRAQTPGGVVLTGTSSLRISGDHLHVEGLHFKDGNAMNSGHVVQFRGSLGQATNSRFTNSIIDSYNPPSQDDRYHWVSLYGSSNRVDHNRFINQNHSGVTVVTWLNDGATTPVSHRIDSNHFADRPEGTGNGFESIRIGTSSRATQRAEVIVENNVFERADGEIEIISNKSGGNTFRYNTFRESAGTLTLRHGSDANVTGNFFLGNGKDRSGGIRVIGEDHNITNNYIEGVDGRSDGAIAITAGVDSDDPTQYEQVKNVTIAHNTIVNVERAGIVFDSLYDANDQNLLAENVTIAANILANTSGSLFEGQEGANWTWADNLVHGSDLGIEARSGITEADPMLVRGANGLLRPGSGSLAIDGGTAGLVEYDFDGQRRIGLPDIGADEFSSARIFRKPLNGSDVGDSWSDPSSLPSQESYLVIQAENASGVVDPDGDGEGWQVADRANASRGKVLSAANSSRPDLDSEPQESVALYDIEFAEEGLYTVYYRARGFGSDSDSFFAPEELGLDPDSSVATSSDGLFDWVVGDQYDITMSNVGVPLEFRLGAREQLSEIDVIIFHRNGNLTGTQLNALLAVPEPTSTVIVALSAVCCLIRRRRAV